MGNREVTSRALQLSAVTVHDILLGTFTSVHVLLGTVESCSIDTLRNAVKTFADMEILTHSNGNVLQVTDADKLLEIAESISDFKS